EATQERPYLQGAQQLGEWVIANTSDTRGSGGFTAGYEGWETGAPTASSVTCASNVLVNGQCQLLYKSTADNIDLYAAFSRLNIDQENACLAEEASTGGACDLLPPSQPADLWANAAQQAKTFVLSMWNADPNSGGYFWIGTEEDGVTVNQDVIPVDIQARAIQALGADAQPYVAALNYVEKNYVT